MTNDFKVDIKVLNAEWDRGRGEKEEGDKKHFYVSGWNVKVMVMSFIERKKNLVFKNLSWFFKNLTSPRLEGFYTSPIIYGIISLWESPTETQGKVNMAGSTTIKLSFVFKDEKKNRKKRTKIIICK